MMAAERGRDLGQAIAATQSAASSPLGELNLG
jgi:hypothetical protein